MCDHSGNSLMCEESADENRPAGELSLTRKIMRIVRPKLLSAFLAVGALCASVEYAILVFLHRYMEFGLLASNMAALIVALLLGYTLHSSWTFRAVHARNLKLFTKFTAVVLVGIILNNATLLFLVNSAGMQVELAKPIQLGIVFFWNYFGQRIFTFGGRTKENELR